MKTLPFSEQTQHFKVEKVLNIPASQVWAIVGADYGSIANSHPKIVNSKYTNHSIDAKE